MPVCSRIESTSWAAEGSRQQFVAVPHPNTKGSVNFVGVLQRFLPRWTVRELADGRIAGDARADLSSPRAQAETVLYLLETSVTIEDSADASHTLRLHNARDEETGNWVHSDIGKLVRRAKSYDLDRSPGDRQAAARLANEMLYWIEEMPLYSDTHVIVSAPSTNPKKDYDLPAFIAQHLSSRTSKAIVTIQSSNTVPQKNLPEWEKASADELASRYAVGGDVRGKIALVIDDIYETGATVNAMAQVLREAGATTVLSLTATKAATGCQGLTPNTANWPMEA